MAMGFLLECLHKVDLGNFQCPNGESDLHQLFFVVVEVIQLILMQKLCIFYAPVVKITFDWGLTMSGRVLVRLGGGVKINRVEKKSRVF